jgi:hypothetical protein
MRIIRLLGNDAWYGSRDKLDGKEVYAVLSSGKYRWKKVDRPYGRTTKYWWKIIGPHGSKHNPYFFMDGSVITVRRKRVRK